MGSTPTEKPSHNGNALFKNEAERKSLLSATPTLLAQIETPSERLIDISIDQPTLNACLKIALDMQLFQKWAVEGDVVLSSGELARACGVEDALMRRLLAHLVSNCVVEQQDTDAFRQTAFSKAMCDPGKTCWMQLLNDVVDPLCQRLPDYLQGTKYSDPRDPTDGPFQAVHSTPGSSLYDYYAEHPIEAAAFNQCMTDYATTHDRWLTYFPSDQLIDDSAAPVLMDIGGNVGHDLQEFALKHPESCHRLVLQDLPQVLEQRSCDAKTKSMPHDFFTEQPVKGARAYFMKGCLHNWSDAQCIEILHNIRPAMRPGYSKLLINETVVPDFRPSAQSTALDLVIMVMTAARERSESLSRTLLQAAGFKIVKIPSSSTALQSIVEAEPEE